MSAYPFQLLQDNYKLAGMAKDKLNQCISPRSSHSKKSIEFNLREVVGHANLLDNVLTNIDNIKFDYIKEQEYKLHQRSNDFFRNNTSNGHSKNHQLYYTASYDEEEEEQEEKHDENNYIADSHQFDSDNRLDEDDVNDDSFTLYHPIPIFNSVSRSAHGDSNTYNTDPIYIWEGLRQ